MIDMPVYHSFSPCIKDLELQCVQSETFFLADGDHFNKLLLRCSK